MGRRRPVRHTVHTKHPRYNVPNYPRGSGSGHSGEKLRKRINASRLQGYDPKYYQIYQNPFRPDRRDYDFIGVKPYLSGRKTVSYRWEKIVAEDAKWRAFLKNHGFRKIASAPDGKDIIYRNPSGMYVITQRDSVGKMHKMNVTDLGYVRFDAHPDRIDQLENMVREFRGLGKVSGMDTDYIGQRISISERGMLVWSKDGEEQPSSRDFQPVSLQMEFLHKEKNKIKRLPDDNPRKKFLLNLNRFNIKALKGVKN